MNYQRVVILKEKSSQQRYLPIWIGGAEAESIAIKLQDVPIARPLTHDLVTNIIGELGAKISAIVVSDLTDDTFFAKIVLDDDGSQVEIDSRPSDAIALAVRTKAPIYVDEGVLDRAGVPSDKETGKPITDARTEEPDREVSEDELKRLSAFRDFVDELDLDLGESERD